jgi:ABC-2 type transport system permease protein
MSEAMTKTAAATRPVTRRGSAVPIFTMTLRSILWTRRTPLLFLFLLLPFGVTLILLPSLAEGSYTSFEGTDAPPGEEGRYWFEDMTMIIYLGMILPLAIAYLATRLIGDEVANKTLPYLFVRPVPRWQVFLAKFAAFAVGMYVLAALAVVPNFFVSLGATQNPWTDAGELLAVLGIVLLAVLANGAFFAFLGVSVRYPLIFAIAYYFLWENIFGSFPAQIKRFTMLFYERSLVTAAGDRQSFVDEFLGLQVDPGPAVFVLLAVFVVFVAASCVVVSMKDYNV